MTQDYVNTGDCPDARAVDCESTSLRVKSRRSSILHFTGIIAGVLLCCGLCASYGAGELDGFDGRLKSNNTGSKTYSWGLEYREPLGDHFAAGFTWVNEGHLPNNHRDGQALQLWWHSRPDLKGLVFEAGIGPYRYYDTHTLRPDPEFHDAHGWGALGSAAVDWYFANHWFSFLRMNQVSASDKYSSTALVAGAGYRFSAKFDLSPASAAAGSGAASGPAPLWEIDGLLGERVANTAHSETGLSEGSASRRT